MDAKIDALFAEWNRPDSPGWWRWCEPQRHDGVRARLRDGQPRAEGPDHAGHLLRPASIAKPFTALSVMLLAEQGKLSLDDEAELRAGVGEPAGSRHHRASPGAYRRSSRRVPAHRACAPAAPGVDINEHILRTSPGSAASTSCRPRNSATTTAVTTCSGASSPVSGQPFREFVSARIFSPLGMTQSSLRGGQVAISPHHARGYHRDDQDFISPVMRASIPRRLSAPGLFTTVGDLLRFAQNFGDARVGSRSSQRDANGGVARRERQQPLGLGWRLASMAA